MFVIFGMAAVPFLCRDSFFTKISYHRNESSSVCPSLSVICEPKILYSDQQLVAVHSIIKKVSLAGYTCQFSFCQKQICICINAAVIFVFTAKTMHCHSLQCFHYLFLLLYWRVLPVAPSKAMRYCGQFGSKMAKTSPLIIPTLLKELPKDRDS